MGYYAERLRERLKCLSKQEKEQLWEQLSYLNEMGPIVSDYKWAFEYGVNDIMPSSSSYQVEFDRDVEYRLAA